MSYGKVMLITIAVVGSVGALTAFYRNIATKQVPINVAIAEVDTSVIGALRHPDTATLELWSEAAGVPTAFTFAVAWEETRNNADPSVRGKSGEWGRFQIQSYTAKARCPGLNIREYHDNLACFLRMAREDWQKTGSWRSAARIHNGSGTHAEGYANRVMKTVRVIVNAKVGEV